MRLDDWILSAESIKPLMLRRAQTKNLRPDHLEFPKCEAIYCAFKTLRNTDQAANAILKKTFRQIRLSIALRRFYLSIAIPIQVSSNFYTTSQATVCKVLSNTSMSIRLKLQTYKVAF